MRSTMHNNWLNNLMALHMYQGEIDKVDIRKLTKGVIAKKNSRKERFFIASFVISGMILFRW